MILVGKKLCRLAWPDAKESFDGRQEPAQRHHPRRRCHVANRFGGWRDGSDRGYATTRDSSLALAERHDRAQAAEAGGDSISKQAGEDCLETDGQRRAVPARERRTYANADIDLTET